LNFANSVVVLEVVDQSTLLLVLSLVYALGLIYWTYRWRTKFRIEQAIVAQYEPIPDFKPMFTGVLFDGILDSRDITAGIIYLAQQGYIKIKQIKEKFLIFTTEDYQVDLHKDIPESDQSYDDEIVSMLFGYVRSQGGVVRLSEVKKDRTKLVRNQSIYRKLARLISSEMVSQGFVEQNFKSVPKALSFLVSLIVASILAKKEILPPPVFCHYFS
jgi:hypothetical protein